MGAKDLVLSYYPFPTVDPVGNPASIMEALVDGTIDVVVVWGPVAGISRPNEGRRWKSFLSIAQREKRLG